MAVSLKLPAVGESSDPAFDPGEIVEDRRPHEARLVPDERLEVLLHLRETLPAEGERRHVALEVEARELVAVEFGRGANVDALDDDGLDAPLGVLDRRAGGRGRTS